MTTSRPRVCFVLPSLNGGGAERAAVHVLNSLDPDRWNRAMYLFERTGPYLSDLAADIDLAVGAPTKRPGRFQQLRRYFQRTRPDVVVAFLSYFSVLLAARTAARTRVVFNQQTPITPFLRDRDYAWSQPWRRRTFSVVAQLAYRSVDHVVAASGGVADDLTRAYGVPPRRIAVVHNPVDVDGVRRAAAEPLPAAHQRLWCSPTIVAVGRLAEQKNYPLLLEAIAILRQRVPARLFILGQGSLEAALRDRIARPDLADGVVLCGFQPNPWKYMARADVFALTSRYEGFGNVMVEAMACGVPVVATSSDVTREVVRDGIDGLLVDRHQPAAVAGALERVIADAALRRRLADGARTGAEGYALPVIAAEYERVFAKLVA